MAHIHLVPLFTNICVQMKIIIIINTPSSNHIEFEKYHWDSNNSDSISKVRTCYTSYFIAYSLQILQAVFDMENIMDHCYSVSI